jgi:hypothetical protein
MKTLINLCYGHPLVSLVSIFILTLSTFAGCDKKGNEPEPLPPPPPSAQFTEFWVDIDRADETITLSAILELKGFKDHTFTLGGYWFRRCGDGYCFVKSVCQTNVPENLLGHQWRLTACCNDATFKGTGFYVPWDCFGDKTGYYYGMITIYRTDNLPIEPNSCAHARTGFIEITWDTSNSASSDDSFPSMRLLSEDESRDIERAIRDLGETLRAQVNQSG